MGIFIGLQRGEQQAENDGEHEAPDQALAVILQQRMVGPGDSCTRGQQDQRVDQRQVPRIENLGVLDNAINNRCGRPHGARCQRACLLDGFAREQRGIKEGPEPGDEEHDFRGNEHQHAIAQDAGRQPACDHPDGLP